MLTILAAVLVIGLVILLLRFGLGILSVLLQALVWLIIKVPCGLVLLVVGLLLCCTILLIPAGVKVMGAGARLIIPGV